MLLLTPINLSTCVLVFFYRRKKEALYAPGALDSDTCE